MCEACLYTVPLNRADADHLARMQNDHFLLLIKEQEAAHPDEPKLVAAQVPTTGIG